MESVVVLTIRGWDGSRILGVYSSMKKAVECQETFVAKNKSASRPKEEFEFDVMIVDQLSIGSKMTILNTGSHDSALNRNHTYEY